MEATGCGAAHRAALSPPADMGHRMPISGHSPSDVGGILVGLMALGGQRLGRAYMMVALVCVGATDGSSMGR